MEQELYELPEGWAWSVLPDLIGSNGLFTDGDWVESKDQDPNGDVRLIQLADVGIGEFRDRSSRFLSSDKAKELRCSFLKPGDILFARMPDPIGRACLFPGDVKQSVTVVDVAIIRPQPENVDHKWLVYQINSPQFYSSVVSLQKGATRKRISRKNLSTIRFPLPPLNEQKRIVAKLDALFTRIDTAIAHLQQTLGLTKALFESASAHVFKDADEWDTVKLSELLERGWITSHLDGNHGSNYPRKAEFVDKGVPYISANCIRNDEVIMGLSKYLTPKRASILRKGVAMNNDVLFAHNATVGPVAILHTDCAKVILSTSLTYYRCDPKHILPEYLAQYMKAPPFTSQYRAIMSQSTRNQVPITKQREFTHIVPPLETQSRIAAQLDSLSGSTRILEATTQKKLNDLVALKASLLDAAFKGKL